MSCERCRELLLLVEVRAMAVATAGSQFGPGTGRPLIEARQALHFAADELARHQGREHLPTRGTDDARR